MEGQRRGAHLALAPKNAVTRLESFSRVSMKATRRGNKIQRAALVLALGFPGGAQVSLPEPCEGPCSYDAWRCCRRRSALYIVSNAVPNTSILASTKAQRPVPSRSSMKHTQRTQACGTSQAPKPAVNGVGSNECERNQNMSDEYKSKFHEPIRREQRWGWRIRHGTILASWIPPSRPAFRCLYNIDSACTK